VIFSVVLAEKIPSLSLPKMPSWQASAIVALARGGWGDEFSVVSRGRTASEVPRKIEAIEEIKEDVVLF
jgi:hypothetical protein